MFAHSIAYRPPGLFKTFFNSVKPFIDPKTAAKMVFITGDVSDGSANDKLMRDLIGDDWKVLTGAEQPILQKTKPASSPGYLHSQQWPALMKRVEAVRRREHAELQQIAATSRTECPPKIIKHITETTAKVALPVLYDEVDDLKRTTYASHAEFKKAKLVVQTALSHETATSYNLFSSSSRDDGVVLTFTLLMLEKIFFLFEDMVHFHKYLSHLVDTYLGPSTIPTKFFIRLVLILFLFFHAGQNPNMRKFAFIYIISYLTCFFLLHDLRLCKKAVDAFVRKHAL